MLHVIFATKMCILLKQEFCENADIITRSAQVFRVLKSLDQTQCAACYWGLNVK